jgi:hypothetical protein
MRRRRPCPKIVDEALRAFLVLAGPVQVHPRNKVLGELDAAQEDRMPSGGDRLGQDSLVAIAIAPALPEAGLSSDDLREGGRIGQIPPLDVRIRTRDHRDGPELSPESALDSTPGLRVRRAVCVDGHHEQIRTAGQSTSDGSLVETKLLQDFRAAAARRAHTGFERHPGVGRETPDQRAKEPLVRRVLCQQVHDHGLLIDRTTEDETFEESVLAPRREGLRDLMIAEQWPGDVER